MAYNPNDVTAAGLYDDEGSFWFTYDLVEEVPAFDFDPATDPKWMCGGEVGTDAFKFEQSSDEASQEVFGKVLKQFYTKFKDKLTVPFASTLDMDVQGLVFGRDRVTLDTAGNIVTAVGPRQPEAVSVFVKTKTDDGRKRVAFAPKAQMDPNISYDWTADDIVIYEGAFNLMGYKGLQNHYEMTEGLNGAVEVATNAAVTVLPSTTSDKD